MRFRVAVALLVIVAARSVSGQTNPEDVVRAFFKAEDEGRWVDAARMLDLKKFEPIQRNAVTGLRNRGTYRQTTAEDLMKADPNMPRAAAEYQIKRMNADSRVEDYLSQQWARVPSVDSLAELSTEDAAARWLEAQGPEWRTDRSIQHSRTPLVDCPGLSDSAKRAMLINSARSQHSVVLGATAGSGSVRYVVIGEESDPPRNPVNGLWRSPSVMTLVSVSGAWRITPTPDMPRSNGLGGTVTVAIACGKGTITSLSPAN